MSIPQCATAGPGCTEAFMGWTVSRKVLESFPERGNIRALVAHRYGDVGNVWRPTDPLTSDLCVSSFKIY
jgi:hypothetical protein